MTRRDLVALMVALVLAVASVGAATAETIPLQHLRAPMVQQWLMDLLAADKLGVDKENVDRIGVVIRDNNVQLEVEGEPAAVGAIKAAVATADVARPQIQIGMKILELADATALLGNAQPARTITLPNGETVPAPGSPTNTGDAGSDWLSGMHLVMTTAPGASLAQFGDDSGFGGSDMGGTRSRSSRTTIVVNPLVDEAVVTQLIDSGQATLITQPRLTTFEGVPGSIGFRVVAPSDSAPREYDSTYTLSAVRGEDGLVTVKLLCVERGPQGEEWLGPLQYTARLGQTVAVAALRSDDPMDRVFLLTVTAVE